MGLKLIYKKGYVLIEAIIALSVLTGGFLSLIYLLNSAIGLNRVVAENYIATYLAAEGIEIVQNLISNNVLMGRLWNNGLSDGEYEVDYNSSFLNSYQDRFLNLDNNNRYTYNLGSPTKFKRKIILQNFNDFIKVISIVSWRGRGGDYQIQLEDVFYNIYIGGPSSTNLSSGSSLPGSSPTGSPSLQTEIDILSFFLRPNIIPYPGRNINYSPTELMEISTLQPGTIQIDQFVSGNYIYLEKYRDSTQVVKYLYDDNYIYLKEDSSGQYPYSFTSGRWLKRFMQVGEVVEETSNYITEYSPTTCEVINYKPWQYKVKLKEYYPSYNVGGNIGNAEVVVVEYDWTQSNGGIPAVEIEFYAKGYGIFRWEEYINGELKRVVNTPYINNTQSNPPPIPRGICFNYNF